MARMMDESLSKRTVDDPVKAEKRYKVLSRVVNPETKEWFKREVKSTYPTFIDGWVKFLREDGFLVLRMRLSLLDIRRIPLDEIRMDYRTLHGNLAARWDS